MLEKIHEVGYGVLVLVGELHNLYTFAFRDKIGTRVACATLILSLSNGIYARNLQWDSTGKSPMEWKDFYEEGGGGRRSTIFQNKK